MRFAEKSRAMRPLVESVLDSDDLLRSYREGTVLALADLSALATISAIEAVELGQARERQDLLAYLRGRQRAAETVARNNPAEAERAKIIAQQIRVEIEAIEQGLHEGDAAKEIAMQQSAEG
jgi:hypothetical protein